MKALVLSTYYPVSEFGPSIPFEISKGLAKKGIRQVKIIPQLPAGVKKIGIDGVKVSEFSYFFPQRLQKLAYGSGIPANLRKSTLAKLQLPAFMLSFFLKVLKEGKDCDFIHAHWTLPGFIAALSKQFLGKKILLTVHGSDINEAKNSLLKRFVKVALEKSDRIVTVSSDLKEKIIAFGIPEGKIAVIPNGIDCRKFKPLPLGKKTELRKKLGISGKKKVLLYIGRLAEEKGVEHLVRAFAKIAQKEKDSILIIIGNGDLKEKILALSERLGVNEKVKLLGTKSHDEMPEFYNIADVFALPSLNEGFGVSLIEAMACGIPCVGSKTGGIKDIIREGENGFFAQPGSEKELAEKILALLSNEKLRKKLGKNARAFVLKSFSTQSMIDKYFKEYQKIAKM